MSIIRGTSGNDILLGTGGADTIYGSGGTDSIDGGDGNDTIFGYAQSQTEVANDILNGGAGDDTIYAGNGNNVIDGGAGDDRIYAGNGNNTIIDASGNNTISVGDGNNLIDTGTGFSAIYAGKGNDTYLIGSQHFDLYDRGGTDAAIVRASFVKIPSSIELVSYVDGAQKLPYWLDALLADNAAGYTALVGAARTVYFTFPTALPSYDTSATDGTNFLPFTAQQQAFTRETLKYIASIVNIQFVETTNAAAANTIAFADNSQVGSGAYAYLPSTSFVGSDVFMNRDSAGNLAPRDGQYAALTLVHELGHALGLKHPFSEPDALGMPGPGPYLPASEDSAAWSVMSYTRTPAQYHATYSPLDIAALQYLYGPSQTAHSGNDTYLLTTNATNLIWDGAGIDTLDGSSLVQNAVLYLDPGYWGYIGSQARTISSPGQVSVNFGTVIENLSGGSGNDSLFGNAQDNVIKGNQGDDVIWGNGGNDTIDGGSGTDTAAYTGKASAFQITTTTVGYTVTDLKGSQGIDTLVNVEQLQFTGELGNYVVSNAALIRTDALLYLPFSGKQIINGGALLTETAKFDGNAADYTVRTDTITGTTVVTSKLDAANIDTFIGIERLQFADQTDAIDVLGHGGQAYRLYQAAFNRVPDLGGLGFHIHSLDVGLSEHDLATQFIASAEFAASYGSLTNARFVDQLYLNVLHRAGDAGGIKFYNDILTNRPDVRADVLLGFSDSPENQVALVGKMDHGIAFTPLG